MDYAAKKRRALGRTGIEVGELCFGALPFGPLQKALPEDECAGVLAAALCGGVDFVDTAQMYRTYGAIREAMARAGKRPVIASKCAAADGESMRRAIGESLDALGLDRIDIFHLHAARAGADVFSVRSGAFEELLRAKSDGLVRAVGVSAHSVATVRAAAERDELDVVFPILNVGGFGILDGGRPEMEAAIASCVAAGKGIYLMKALGGGILIQRYAEALNYARSVPGVASVALGMVSEEEVAFNLEAFALDGPLQRGPAVSGKGKAFIAVPSLCVGCGTCLGACAQGAISLEGKKARIDPVRCIRCGYCVGACPSFAIRMV